MSVAKTLEQEFLQPGDNLGLFRGDIGELTRVALQVIEPNVAARRGIIRLIAIGALAPARANNKFVAIGLYAGFFVLEVLAEDMVSRRRRPMSFQIRPEAVAVRDGQRLGAEQFEDGRRDVDRFREVVE